MGKLISPPFRHLPPGSGKGLPMTVLQEIKKIIGMLFTGELFLSIRGVKAGNLNHQ